MHLYVLVLAGVEIWQPLCTPILSMVYVLCYCCGFRVKACNGTYNYGTSTISERADKSKYRSFLWKNEDVLWHFFLVIVCDLLIRQTLLLCLWKKKKKKKKKSILCCYLFNCLSHHCDTLSSYDSKWKWSSHGRVNMPIHDGTLLRGSYWHAFYFWTDSRIQKQQKKKDDLMLTLVHLFSFYMLKYVFSCRTCI